MGETEQSVKFFLTLQMLEVGGSSSSYVNMLWRCCAYSRHATTLCMQLNTTITVLTSSLNVQALKEGGSGSSYVNMLWLLLWLWRACTLSWLVQDMPCSDW